MQNEIEKHRIKALKNYIYFYLNRNMPVSQERVREYNDLIKKYKEEE